ncbi:MAG: S-layer homology domain-containing protein, partial [Oscillospiraceae bacterium]|nr:S-layer homology domain-containing protein [Oscillospiraceae bacterium]
DQQTGEIYCVDDRAYLVHSIVLESAGAAASAARFVWNGTNRDGAILPDGTAVTVAFYAWLETETQFGNAYDTHSREIKKGDYDWLIGGEFDDCMEWDFPLVLDASVPQVSCRLDENGDAVITVADGQFTAYAAVQDETSSYLAAEAYADVYAGESHTIFHARQEYAGQTLYVTVADYAGNATGYEIDLAEQTTGNVTVRRCPVAMLTDVPKDAWYHEAVDYVIDRGLMSVGDDLVFSPERGALRVAVQNMLYDLAGRPQMEQDVVALPFQDASKNTDYRAALEWAYSEGIVTGYDDTFFGAYAVIQRSHLAAMLYRAAKAAGEDVSCAENTLSGFADAGSIPEWAQEALGWAVEKGYLAVDESGNIASTAYVTRAEFAQILMMLYENQEIREDMSNGTE